METLAIVFALLAIYLGIIQLADVVAGQVKAANIAGNTAVIAVFAAVSSAVLVAAGV
jgi:hypothetical protein